MLKQDNMLTLNEAVEQEAAREEYPQNFPPLPEIPGGRYFDKAFYDLEIKHVWKKTWVIAGHASELPEPGSHLLFGHLGLSIVIARGKDGQIRAFHNVCRHRGAPLVMAGGGTTKRFTCPYHSWSYNLEGELVAVPEEFNFACLDRSERGLIPVRCENWRGFVFINLDDNAGSLTDFLGAVVRETADFPLEKLRVQKSARLTMRCNWKAMYDNFLESYHVSTLHPQSLYPYLDPKRMLVSLFENGHIRMKTKKKIINRVTHGTDAKAPVMDDETGLFEEFNTGSPIFPNAQMGLDPNGFPLQTFWPNGPGEAIMDVRMLGWDGDGTSDPGYWDKLMSDTLAIIDEDLGLMNRIQDSLEGGYFTGMMLSYTERPIYWYHEEIDRRIGAERISPELRVQQVLADQVTR